MTLAAAGLVVGLYGGKDKGDRNDLLVETARACARHGEMSCPRPIFTVQIACGELLHFAAHRDVATCG